ncbi:MAG: hypothetical protein CND89_05245 [Marine Group II euryarchaeote MED-G38]|uniref:Cysteine dioxygenase CDO1 n=1 Tax=uncultured Poseidoniia archaeon TaxID=1697135 RepID=A0A1B1T9P1_9ARCH|nr:Cysteine dioxygenase CDO1 [uncultured Candidatus Thalassoarchaea sp.]MAV60439.1 hypothetical protein [Euryarchaeota archaeon]OUV25468.1 MAG: hypothetical protein CBC57_05050 [Euryarchaeota archaeon TMED97]PDH21972.1 MAG: hypothetical protein CND89_05245 [Marine Group II euryarchaeote MED-G38]|tara:strand:- start:3443 stop:3964 length:522 start_codon:yes stop_codon:yes gene_type:complete
MATHVVLSNDVREKLLSECSEITSFLDWLESIDRRPGLDELAMKLSNLNPNIDAVENSVGYAEEGYKRHVIKENNFYELAIICWKPGQATPIHDHEGSDCAFLIVSGVSTETTYKINEEGVPFPTDLTIRKSGEICAAKEQDIHTVSNEGDVGLVELHVYTPPLSGYNIYSSG